MGVVLTQAIVSAAEAIEARTYDNAPAVWIARMVDAVSPGVGVNLNPNATDYDAGDIVTYTGAGILGTPNLLIADNSATTEFKAFVNTLPWCVIDTDQLFGPYPDP